MKVRALIAAITLALGLSLSACGIGGPAQTQAVDQPAAASQTQVVEARKATPGIGKILKCRDGLMTVDLPLGVIQELDGTSYQLVEKKTETPYDDPFEQESVALSVKLSGTASLPAAIVHSTSGERRSRPSSGLDDKSLDLNVHAGGNGSFTLATIAYTEFPTLGDRVTSVSLCLNLSQTNKSDG